MEKEDKEKFITEIKERIRPFITKNFKGEEDEEFQNFVKHLQAGINQKIKKEGMLFYTNTDYCEATYNAIEKWIFIKNIKIKIRPFNLQDQIEDTKINFSEINMGKECIGFKKFVSWVQKNICDEKIKQSNQPIKRKAEDGEIFTDDKGTHCTMTYKAIKGFLKQEDNLRTIKKEIQQLIYEIEYIYTEEEKRKLYNEINNEWIPIKEKLNKTKPSSVSRSERNIKRHKETIIRRMRSFPSLLTIQNYQTSNWNYKRIKEFIDSLLIKIINE